jgi:hypothetical protein
MGPAASENTLLTWSKVLVVFGILLIAATALADGVASWMDIKAVKLPSPYLGLTVLLLGIALMVLAYLTAAPLRERKND